MIKFHFIGDTSKAYSNVIVIASEIVDLSDDGDKIYKAIKFQFALSNDKDRYDKGLGKELAMIRFKTKPYYLPINDFTFVSIVEQMVKFIQLDTNSPKWVNDVIGKYRWKRLNNLEPNLIAKLGDWIQKVEIEYKSKNAMEHNYQFIDELHINGKDYQLRQLISNSNVNFRIGKYENKNNEEKFATYFQLEMNPELDLLGYKELHEVEWVKTAKELQGDGIAETVYVYLVKNLHFTLMAGVEQYTGARRLWSRLSKRNDVSVDIINLKTKEIIKQNEVLKQGANELDFDEHYWSLGNEHRDIRFILRK